MLVRNRSPSAKYIEQHGRVLHVAALHAACEQHPSDFLSWAIGSVSFARRMKTRTQHHPDDRQVLRWATTKRINSYLLRTHPRQHDDARDVLRATTSTTLVEPMETITLECNTSKTLNTFHPFFKLTLTARSHTHMEHVRTYVSCNYKVHIDKHPHVQRSANCVTFASHSCGISPRFQPLPVQCRTRASTFQIAKRRPAQPDDCTS